MCEERIIYYWQAACTSVTNACVLLTECPDNCKKCEYNDVQSSTLCNNNECNIGYAQDFTNGEENCHSESICNRH